MAVYVVDYDLRQRDRDYDPLIEALKQYESCHALKSTWFIDSALSAAAILTDLRKHVHQNDQIFVLRIHKIGVWHRNEDCSQWLLDPTRSY
jgi:hypothetical protein